MSTTARDTKKAAAGATATAVDHTYREQDMTTETSIARTGDTTNRPYPAPDEGVVALPAWAEHATPWAWDTGNEVWIRIVGASFRDGADELLEVQATQQFNLKCVVTCSEPSLDGQMGIEVPMEKLADVGAWLRGLAAITRDSASGMVLF